MRQAQQVIDQAPHMFGARHDALQVTVGIGVQLRPALFGKRIRKALDVAQRSAQIVSHRIGECLQLLVGGLQFDSALRHPLFQVLASSL